MQAFLATVAAAIGIAIILAGISGLLIRAAAKVLFNAYVSYRDAFLVLWGGRWLNIHALAGRYFPPAWIKHMLDITWRQAILIWLFNTGALVIGVVFLWLGLRAL